MKVFIQTTVNLYGILLRLYPREFQAEFREEMQDIFGSIVNDAAKIGIFSFSRACFFELLDLPVNLMIEYSSRLRKEWSMKDMRHDIRPFRSAEMGALGLLIGFFIIMLGREYLVLPNWWYKADLGMLLITLREVIAWTLASALLSLMLYLSVSAGLRATLRACLLMAGFEVAAVLIGTVVVKFTNLENIILSLKGNWQIASIAFVQIILAMIYGLFAGSGLGFAIGGWKSCRRWAIKGLWAYGIGFAIEEIIRQFWLSTDWIWRAGYPATASGFVFVISIFVGGILAGGIFALDVGKGKTKRVFSSGKSWLCELIGSSKSGEQSAHRFVILFSA